MKSQLFYSDRYTAVQDQIKDCLNGQDQFLSGSTVKSTRAVGDAIQDILAENFQSILGSDLCAKYSSKFARRAMADLAFEDTNGFYYVVDVKTHRLSTKFNMPNLTSVERLSRFYEDDKNYFVVLMVAYDIEDLHAVIENVTFVPIEFLGWDCLTIGALGWGQIQIANSNRITINPKYSRKPWMIEFCDTMLEFYPKEIAKIDSRIERFKKIREEWGKRPD
ncbi:MAG: hypothetical protein ACE5EQ_09370 [Phycisphaerae bacterium]